MKRFWLLVWAALLLGSPATAQEAPNTADPTTATAPADAGTVEELAKRINIVTATAQKTAIPENDPVQVDLGLVDVPGVPAKLTEGVTAKGYTRYVVVDGKKVGQLVLGGVEKDGRSEPLNTSDFVAQFDLEKPELDPKTPVVVDGNQDELIAALKRLAEQPEEKEAAEQQEADTAASDGQVGSNAAKNADAAGYQTPDALDVAEAAPIEIRVTADGCDMRVDIGQLVAIQQNRVETTENGSTSSTPCEDGDQRYPLDRSYAACADAVDIEGLTATAQYLLFYTDGGGTRNEVSECQPDEDKVFQIVEKRDECTVQLDYQNMMAIPRAALIYVNAANNEVQVRGCEASAEVEPVPLTQTFDGCSIRHDFAAGLSYQQGRSTYEMDGVLWQAGSCTDSDTTYPHNKVYTGAGGAKVCDPIINMDAGTATMQYRLQISVAGLPQYISDCTPDSSTMAVIATTEGCENPATWTHDLLAGVSYGKQRYYYLRDGLREYLTQCQDGGATYTHQVEHAGWQPHDDQLFSYELTTVYISAPSGRYDIKRSEILPGAPETPYVYVGVQKVVNDQLWYEGCTRWRGRDTVESYTRPDGSSYDVIVGVAPPLDDGNACTVDTPDKPDLWKNGKIYATWIQSAKEYCYRDDGDGNCSSVASDAAIATFQNQCSYKGTRTVTREDGKVISSTTESMVTAKGRNYSWSINTVNGTTPIMELMGGTCGTGTPGCPRLTGQTGGTWKGPNWGSYTYTLKTNCDSVPDTADVSAWLKQLGW